MIYALVSGEHYKQSENELVTEDKSKILNKIAEIWDEVEDYLVVEAWDDGDKVEEVWIEKRNGYYIAIHGKESAINKAKEFLG